MRTAVLPVAGFGTRWLPITKAVPKELLPVLDRPCVEYAVVEAAAAGIERIVLVTTHGKEPLADYFDHAPELERHLEERGRADLLELVRSRSRLVDVVMVRQRDARGLGLAVRSAAAAVGDEPFVVLLADDIIDAPRPAIGQMLEACPEGRAAVALMPVADDQVESYGICEGRWLPDGTMDVGRMIEKPRPEQTASREAIIGRYILPPDIFEVIDRTPPGRGDEVQLTDALAALAAQGRVRGIRFQGRRFDAGSLPGWLEANLYFARQRPELRAIVRAAQGPGPEGEDGPG